MRKTIIMGVMLALSAGFLMVISGCGAVSAYHSNCKRWATRTAYRSVCKSYSANGHCSFWGQEAYQQSYCAEWKTKSDLEYEKSSHSPTYNTTIKTSGSVQKKTPKTGEFILTAGESTKFNGSEELSKGEVFLISQLEPLLCNVIKSNDIEKTLASMGYYKKIGGEYDTIEYSTDIFYGKVNFYGKNKKSYGFYINLQEKHYWPFNDDEYGKWLSSIGLDVLLQVPGIYGLTNFRGGDPKDYLDYDFSISAIRDRYTGKVLNRLYIRGDIGMIVKNTLCH